MRAILFVALCLLTSGIVALPIAAADCSSIERGASAAGATATLTLVDCAEHEEESGYVRDSYANTTRVTLAHEAIGDVSVEVTDASATWSEGQGHGGYQSVGVGVRANDAEVNAGAADTGDESPEHCSGMTIVSVSVWEDSIGGVVLTHLLFSGDGYSLPCGWNDAVLS